MFCLAKFGACQLVLLLDLLLLVLNSAPSLGYAYNRNATKKALGTVVPWPRNVSNYNPRRISYLQIAPTDFSFAPSEEVNNCEIVKKALERYASLYLFEDIRSGGVDDQAGERLKVGDLKSLRLVASSKEKFVCESIPHEEMFEDYELNLTAGSEARLSAKTSWGLIRGLETFSQLVFYEGAKPETNTFGVPTLLIDDGPRFKFRGFMLDTARHFISVQNIKIILDAMAASKLNVFHWHLVDDQSFPYESQVYPELSRKSSFRPNLVYKQTEVKALIEYAAERGIRVLPELDTPGHSYSMRYLTGLLTECYNTTTGKPNGELGPIDPTKVDNFLIVSKLIKELRGVFPDSFFHGGGDEVDYECWKSNPHIGEWMEKRNISGNYDALANLYIRKVYDFVAHHNRSLLVWQEVFDNKANLPKKAIIQVWKYRNDRLAYTAEMRNIVTAGYRAILSSCWYLNYIDYGQDWVKLYQCDPGAGLLSSERNLQQLVLGGEICMWSEFVDDTNVISRSWPRSAAAAERLWSQSTRNNPNEFMGRLEQFRCRLLARGVQAEPVNGPGYC